MWALNDFRTFKLNRNYQKRAMGSLAPVDVNSLNMPWYAQHSLIPWDFVLHGLYMINPD